ncbi:hypothetical protein MLD38_022181 [Melastoma candidum]|uniref:Uncharacterized protein n=1 Tax=Melastoma candidum TaxID=119954 RepID=A0ACB9QJG8_9MYRT|nr:hypothetical protein MLD38_022181 [Melastoma candidum]
MAGFTISFPVIVVAAVVGLASLVTSQSLPPARYDGFVYTDCRFGSDGVMIEAFLDPVCPDSRDSWVPLKKAVQYYRPRVSLVVHLLPLPYHDNAFGASRALHIVNMLKNDSTFPLLELFFNEQEKFYNSQTMNMSRASIVKSLTKFSTQVVGNSYYSAIEAGFNNRTTDLKTRVSFKYSTSKGVDATPSFFLNGFLLPGAGSPIDFKGWKTFIDPLINEHKE